MSKEGQDKIYSMVTNQVIELLEQDEIPWRQSWLGGRPTNLVSGRNYRGINNFMLNVIAKNENFESRFWVTFKQAEKLGGKIKKGAKSTIIVFWKPLKKTVTDEETGEQKEKPFFVLKYYRAFNLSQTEGLKDPDQEQFIEHEPIKDAESVIHNMPNPPQVQEGKNPCYIPDQDVVRMPALNKFDQIEEYYSTYFHELTHSTGHHSRLNREAVGQAHFGSKSYSREELLAEMGACFLCSHAGIEQPIVENSSAYIKGWLKALRGNHKLVIKAASAAQTASDYILGDRIID